MHKSKVDFYRLLAILIICSGILYFYTNLFIPRLIPKTFRIGTLRKPITILILGTDVNFDANTRKEIVGGEGRADTLLLLRVDPVHYKLNMLSIPRDSFVGIPGYGINKINAANVFGGIELVKKSITGLTGKNIDYYLELNPQAVIKLVDLLGGLNFQIEKDMYYVDRAQNLNIDLKQGWHKLSGVEAQDYIRFRHDAVGDIGRMERQQKFLQALLLSFAQPKDIIKAPLALGIAQKHIKTDLPLLKMIRLANFARMLSFSDIRTLSVSFESGTSDYAGSILILDKKDLERIIRDYF